MKRIVPDAPPAARLVFGDRLESAERYVALLAGTGTDHGLIGPCETPRLWDRHVLNSAVVHPLLEEGAEVADVGSGAGLPGIPLAIARPDLHLTLVEPLLRRTRWLEQTVAELGLPNIRVCRARAEELEDATRFDAIVARAVARTAQLARITLPLLRAHGSLHALKGERAEVELAEDADALADLGAASWRVERFGAGVVVPETVVLTVTVRRAVRRAATRSSRPRRGS